MNQSNKSEVSLLEDNILHIRLKENSLFNLNDYKEIRLASLRLTEKRQVYNIIQIGECTIPNKEAREACTRDAVNGFIKAEAIVISSLGQRILANHLLRQQKHIIPRKVFSSLDNAKEWLKNMQQSACGCGSN
jgi:hypothetical protein